MAGQTVTRLMTEVIALSMCTMHARKRRLTWFQHLNLQTLRAGKLDLQAWLQVAVRTSPTFCFLEDIKPSATFEVMPGSHKHWSTQLVEPC